MKLTIWCLCLFSAGFAAPLQVDISARSAILINADSGTILFEKNAHSPQFPASTTKIATALYILDQKHSDLDKTVSVSAEAVRKKTPHNDAPHLIYSDATIMGIVKGEVLTINALLHGLMLVSGNDAANALAEAFSPSISHFTNELNDYVQRLGCAQTHFMNPHGYHHPEHVTTAFDLALITQKALQLPALREIVAKTYFVVPASNKRPEAKLKQFNSLLHNGKYYYPKSIGGKTGYHSLAGRCLVSAAVHEGRTLIAVVLGCPQNENRYLDTRALFDAAFAEKLQRRLLAPITEIYTKTLPGAKTALRAGLPRDLSVTFYPAEEHSLRAFIHWDLPNLPINKGQRVGEIRVMDERGVVVVKEDLIAKEPVFATFLFTIKEKWNKLWR